MIKIIFEQSDGQVLLDKKIYNIVDHCVDINLSGWHLLSISAVTTDYLQIKDITIEGISIGHMMMIMFSAESKQCTFGWVDHQEFCMPLHPNYAIFRAVVFYHIDQGDYGSQIYEQYDFSLNYSPVLQHQYPKRIVDYFLQETPPTWYKKFHHRSPWFLGPQIDRKKLAEEINRVKHKFSERPIKADHYVGWSDAWIKINDVQDVYNIGLEYFSQILLQCKFTKMEYVNIAYLQPGGFIDSHRDSVLEKKARQKVYIPIDISFGNYFKFLPGGYVELNSSNAVCMNVDSNLHSVVNDSNSTRLIISGTGYADWF